MRDENDDPGAPARIVVYGLVVWLAIALILGLATGTINEKTFAAPQASASDPITLP